MSSSDSANDVTKGNSINMSKSSTSKIGTSTEDKLDGFQKGNSRVTTAQQPLTIHSYAITRSGARKLIRCYDHCGRVLEEQVQYCVQAGLLTHSYAKVALFSKRE